MWLEIIQEFNKNNKQLLDFKFELHLAIYNKVLLKDKIKLYNFKIKHISSSFNYANYRMERPHICRIIFSY